MADPTSAAAAAAAPTLEDSASEKEGGEEEDAVVNPTVTVNIKTLNGPDFELLVGRDEPVSELKTKVRRETNVEEVRVYAVWSVARARFNVAAGRRGSRRSSLEQLKIDGEGEVGRTEGVGWAFIRDFLVHEWIRAVQRRRPAAAGASPRSE